METIFSYLGQKTNYKLMNEPNIFNCFIAILDKQEDDDDKKFIINLIKLNIGMSFIDDFKLYLFRKDCNNDLIKLLS